MKGLYQRLRGISLEIEENEYLRFYKLNKPGRDKILDRIKKMIINRDEIVLAFIYGSFLTGKIFYDIDTSVYTKPVA